VIGTVATFATRAGLFADRIWPGAVTRRTRSLGLSGYAAPTSTQLCASDEDAEFSREQWE
jgi:hypothetical protein